MSGQAAGRGRVLLVDQWVAEWVTRHGGAAGPRRNPARATLKARCPLGRHDHHRGYGQGGDEGADSGCVNDVWWSEDGREWHEVEGSPWPARHAASVWVHQGSLWMAAGSRTDIANGCRSDVWRLRKEASL